MPELVYASDGDRETMPMTPRGPESASRVSALLRGAVVSLHEHPVRLPDPLTAQTWAEHLSLGRDVLAGEELRRSELDLVVATCFSQSDPGFVLSWAASMRDQIDDDPLLRPVTGPDDLLAPGRTAIALGLEDLGTVRTIDDIDALAAAGIIMAGLAYNTGSLLGCGLAQDDTGVTAFGREAIVRMNRIGMAIDLSHAGDRTSREAVDLSSAPVLLNHAGARSLWGSARMVPDDVIRAVVERGGVIGIEAAPGSTRTRRDEPGHTIDDVVRHVEHCADSFGVAAVSIGGDTFYGDHVGLYRALGSRGSTPPAGALPFDLTPVVGADNPSEIPRQLALALVERGWDDVDVAAVLGGNALRALRAAMTEGRR